MIAFHRDNTGIFVKALCIIVFVSFVVVTALVVLLWKGIDAL